MELGDKDWLACCGSSQFAREMVLAGPFSDYEKALAAAEYIWFNKVSLFSHNYLQIIITYCYSFLINDFD